jgi:hypothetical protein
MSVQRFDVKTCWSLIFCGLLLGCAGELPQTPSHRLDGGSEAGEPSSQGEAALRSATQELLLISSAESEWLPFLLPGKRFAPFEPGAWQGRSALKVNAHRSVSILRQRLTPGLAAPGRLRFSWRVDALPQGANLRESDKADAPVRILLAFDGDLSRWTARTHRLSELSRLLTGEALPYATLSYVWSNAPEPLGTVISNPRTDRIRKIVVESGSARLGQWRDYERDVRADFVHAFGEEPGPLLAVALMTDTDNTQTSLEAWYGALKLEPAVQSR